MKDTVTLYVGIGFNILWLFLHVVFLIWMSWRIKREHSCTAIKHHTVGQLVEEMLAFYEVQNVQVQENEASGNPAVNGETLYMPRAGQNSHSVAVAAMILHEVGHAVQHKNADSLYFLSLFLTKVFRLSSVAAVPGLIAALFLNNHLLLKLCIWIYAISGFTIFMKHAADEKASGYALEFIKDKKILDPIQLKGFGNILAVADWSGIQSVYEPVFALFAGLLSLISGFTAKKH